MVDDWLSLSSQGKKAQGWTPGTRKSQLNDASIHCLTALYSLVLHGHLNYILQCDRKLFLLSQYVNYNIGGF